MRSALFGSSLLVWLTLSLFACEESKIEPSTFPGISEQPVAPVVDPFIPEPDFAAALDAAANQAQGGPLEEALRKRLRALQHRRGERTVLSFREGWDQRADRVMALTRALPRHAVVLEASQERALERLEVLRVAVIAYGQWRGESVQDDAHIKRLVEADHLVAHLWLGAARQLGATEAHPPESERGMEQRLLDALALWDDSDGLIATLAPPMASYDSLVEAYEHYRGLEKVGFVALPRALRKARPNKVHPDIPALRKRLAQEDPLGAGEGDTWDDTLTDALRRARAAFQLKPKRKARYLIDKALLAALSVPVEDRVASLRLNLRRWQRSQIRHYPYVIFVNLPEYRGEVWDGAERLHDFKVVIGNTRKKRGFMINATPVLSSALRTVVYNPYWTVPRRIYEEELLVKAEAYAAKQVLSGELSEGGEEPPDYWAAKGYEVFGKERKNGRVWVRRRPGPGNALGKVKFLFENRWSVFLHDTPQKRKFNATRRAFSHGCVRVHKPLELAELLLKRDGQWAEVEKAKVMSHYKESVFRMKAPVWLVVDYMTARVNDAGRATFYPDVYRKDETLASR